MGAVVFFCAHKQVVANPNLVIRHRQKKMYPVWQPRAKRETTLSRRLMNPEIKVQKNKKTELRGV